MPTSDCNQDAGTGAAAVSAPSPWRTLILRTAIGAIALLGLSGIGASSMLLGLDGAHASPPASPSATTPANAASNASTRAPAPSISTQPAPVTSGVAPIPTAGHCPARTEDGRIILNLASAEDLRQLPGVGTKRAEAILALRAKLKRFKRATDLLRIRGIGPKSLARMQPMFVLDPPPGSHCANVANGVPHPVSR